MFESYYPDQYLGELTMELKEAVGTVLDLARENIISLEDATDNEMPEEHERQQNAIDLVEAFFTGYLGNTAL